MAKRADLVYVKKGQVYRSPRPGAAAKHVKITHVNRRPAQPTCIYREVTRTGNRKPGMDIRHWLQWNGDRWDMGPGFEDTEQLDA